MVLYQKIYPNTHPEIVAALDTAEWNYLVEDLPKLLNSMETGTSRIQDLVLSLRNFARLDESDFKNADLHEGLDNTLLVLSHRINDSTQHPPINIVRQYGRLLQIHCHPGQLNQAFMHLLINAIDALDEQFCPQQTQNLAQGKRHTFVPTITIITGQPTRDVVQVAIKDNGSGISKDVMATLYDPFFTTKDVGKGIGLGLAIRYQIVTETHGGQLTCCSSPSDGTTFTFWLPIVTDQDSE